MLLFGGKLKGCIRPIHGRRQQGHSSSEGRQDEVCIHVMLKRSNIFETSPSRYSLSNSSFNKYNSFFWISWIRPYNEMPRCPRKTHISASSNLLSLKTSEVRSLPPLSFDFVGFIRRDTELSSENFGTYEVFKEHTLESSESSSSFDFVYGCWRLTDSPLRGR